MENKFTAIYIDSWMVGSHQHSLTKMRRIEQKSLCEIGPTDILWGKETIIDMLTREDIIDTVVYLFQGHPLLQGEEEAEALRKEMAGGKK